MKNEILAYTDRDHLLKHNYGTVDDYKVRSGGWESYNRNPVSVVQWALEKVFAREPGKILDAGCGLGRFALEAARLQATTSKAPEKVFAVDISEAMVSAVRTEAERKGLNLEVQQGSIEKLPFSNASFDTVMCNYVLYHVGDIDAAVRELSRVLKPSGLFFSVIPSQRWLPELIDWQDRALLRMGYAHDAAVIKPTGTDRFCADNAHSYLVKRFSTVEVAPYDGSMTFPSVEVLLHHYTHSMRYKNVVAQGVPADELQTQVGLLMAESLEQNGELRVTSRNFCFVGRKRGE